MKKILLTTILLAITSFTTITANASTTSRDELLNLMPGMTSEEVNTAVKEAATSLDKSEDEIVNQMLIELNTQKELIRKEKLENSSKSTRATYMLEAGKYNGDVFYEPAKTIIPHGHVGIYYTADTIVESMPPTDENPINGVRSLHRATKRVDSGSKIFTFKGISYNLQNDASNWAYGRSILREKYSYNFLTNRTTSHDGDKNCSKLVWSAYMVTTNYDLDKDGGLGVYPNDILYHPLASVYRSY